MGRWKYRMEEGSELRDLIREADESNEGKAKVLDKIRELCLIGKDYDGVDDQFEDLYILLEGEAEILRTNPRMVVKEWEFESVTAFVDARLCEFYDACDWNAVWVEP
jgi:hypothetical protein